MSAGVRVCFSRYLFGECVPFSTVASHSRTLMVTAVQRRLNDGRTPQVSNPSNRVFLMNRYQAQVIPFSESLKALRAYSLSEIPETVELSLTVDMSLKKGKTREPFRGTLIYPHKFGVMRKILLIAEDTVGKGHQADIIGSEDLIKQLSDGSFKHDFDVCLCTTTMYDRVKPLQKKLRAKMPNPRRGTVIDPAEISATILKFQQSREYKSDKRGYVNMPVGKLDFTDDQISDNIKCLIDHVSEYRGNLPSTSFIKRGVLSTTFGPGFHTTLANFFL